MRPPKPAVSTVAGGFLVDAAEAGAAGLVVVGLPTVTAGAADGSAVTSMAVGGEGGADGAALAVCAGAFGESAVATLVTTGAADLEEPVEVALFDAITKPSTARATSPAPAPA